MASTPAAPGAAAAKKPKWEVRTLTHPEMPLWLAGRAPLISAVTYRDTPAVFALLEREADAAREREGAPAFAAAVRTVARAETEHDLAFTPDQLRAAVLTYAALRRWMRARGEEEPEPEPEVHGAEQEPEP